MSSQILHATGLDKRYGSLHVLHGIDLTLTRGQVTVILGENGAGKSTLLRLLAGDLLADGGQIAVDGLDLQSQPAAARALLVYVAQHPPMAPLLSLREHAQAMIAFRNLDASAALAQLEQLVNTLNLQQAIDRPIRALSGGMAHKAALVLAFLAKVPLIILDEPHSGLDVRSALALRQLIAQARAQGTTFLLASHLAEATLAIADRAIVLRAGAIALDLSAEQLAQFHGDARAFEQTVLEAMQG